MGQQEEEKTGNHKVLLSGVFVGEKKKGPIDRCKTITQPYSDKRVLL